MILQIHLTSIELGSDKIKFMTMLMNSPIVNLVLWLLYSSSLAAPDVKS